MPGAKKICRMLFNGHPAKEFFAGCRSPAKQPLPGAGHSANSSRRQKLVFAGCRPLGKIWPPAKVAGLTAASGRQPLPGATPLGTRQRIFLFFFNFFAGCPMTWHPAKASLPGALGGTRQIIFLFLFFDPIFLWGLATINISLFQNLGQL